MSNIANRLLYSFFKKVLALLAYVHFFCCIFGRRLLFYVCANPPSGDLSGAALEVPSEALLHPEATVALCSPFAIKWPLKINFRAILLQMCIFCCTFAA